MKKILCSFTLLFAVCSSGPAQTSGVSYRIDTVAGSDVFTETGRALDTWLDNPVDSPDSTVTASLASRSDFAQSIAAPLVRSSYMAEMVLEEAATPTGTRLH